MTLREQRLVYVARTAMKYLLELDVKEGGNKMHQLMAQVLRNEVERVERASKPMTIEEELEETNLRR